MKRMKELEHLHTRPSECPLHNLYILTIINLFSINLPHLTLFSINLPLSPYHYILYKSSTPHLPSLWISPHLPSLWILQFSPLSYLFIYPSSISNSFLSLSLSLYTFLLILNSIHLLLLILLVLSFWQRLLLGQEEFWTLLWLPLYFISYYVS